MRSCVIFFVVGCFTLSARAELISSTTIIPNPFKIDRKGHLSAATAAWSEQRLAGGAYEIGSVAAKTTGTPEAKVDSRLFTAYTYQHFEPATLEVKFSEENSEDRAAPFDGREDGDLSLSLGSQLPGLPLSLGLRIQSGKSKTETSTESSTDRSQSVQLSAGYRLQGPIYLGLGYLQEKQKPDQGSTTESENFYVGAGYANNFSAAELVLSMSDDDNSKGQFLLGQGALNMNIHQLVYELSYSTEDYKANDDKSNDLSIALGFQFKHNALYFQPSLGYRMGEIESGGQRADTNGVSVGVELGLKTKNYNYYLALNNERQESDYTTSDDSTADINSITVGGHSYF